MSETPKTNDGVWHHEYGNGFIKFIDRENEEITVFFWRRVWHKPPVIEVFDTSSFECFDDTFNQWMIYV